MELLILYLGLLQLNEQLKALTSRLAALEQAPRAATLVIRDANGVEVGPLVSIPDGNAIGYTVVEASDGQRFALRVWADQIEGNASSEGQLFFAQPACGGAPHLGAAGNSEKWLLPLITVSWPGFTVYVAVGAPTVIRVTSWRGRTGVCEDMPTPFDYRAHTVVPVSDWSHLVPPFRIDKK